MEFGSYGAMMMAALLLGSGPAGATVLYSNGTFPIPGDVNAWTINSGFAVSDSFIFGSDATVAGVDFGAWVLPGDGITNIDWLISDAPDGGTVFGSGSATAVTRIMDFGNNNFGYDLNLDSFVFSGIDLTPGVYWLTLRNALVASNSQPIGDPAYWDQGGGGSDAWESVLGTLLQPDGTCVGSAPTNGSCAESFDILGPGSRALPEPLTLSVFSMGVVGMVMLRCRKQKKPI